MQHYFFVLKRGQEVVEEIIKFCNEKNIRAAYFTAIGAVSSVELAYYDLQKKEYNYKKFDELEIDTITGNLAVMNDELIIHAHGTFSDKDMKTVGGHFKSAVVSGTCEVFLVPLKESLVRKFDEDTGLNLIK